MTEKKEKKETVQALDRGLRILDALMESESALGVNALAKQQGITPSAAFRILKTLEQCHQVTAEDLKKTNPVKRVAQVVLRIMSPLM